MKGKIIKDWSKVNFREADSRKKMLGALQYFMLQPEGKAGAESKALKSAIQNWAVKGDFPTEILQVLEKYHAVPDYDLGYEQIFDIRDFTGSTESGFRIENVESGLTFSLVKPGEKAKIYGFQGSEASVNFELYGGGLNWLRTLIDDRQYWTLEDNAIAFRNKAYASRAAVFYALIEAITNTTSWQAVTPASVATSNENYNAIRDINTINAACLAILTAVKNKGYGVNANTPFFLLADVGLKSRLERALKMVQQPFMGSGEMRNFNVKPIYTLMLSDTTKYYVGIPKIKSKGGYRMDLTIYDQFDIKAYADTMVGWMRFGGAIGDTDLIKQCAIS